MADVNTTDIVSLRIRGLSINCLPPETVRTDKEIVEKPYVCDGNKYDTNPDADSETAENTTFSLGFSALSARSRFPSCRGTTPYRPWVVITCQSALN